jgi:raffinose/stachyose/melibiose transport system permease protein
VTALKDRGRVIRDPLGLPEVWRFENFLQAWEVGHFGRYLGNSILVVVPVVLAILVLSLVAGYAFALMSFRGKNALFAVFLIGLTIPVGILVIPLFYDLLALGLLNTLWALILPQVAVGLPFGILLMRSFIQQLPREILDAGRIDGCTHLGMLRHIVTPLSLPALASLLVFNFMWTWNQFLLPVVFIQTDAVRTLPVGLNYFQGRFSTDIPLLMAGATITFLPVVLVYIIFQRQFIKGITAGALK